VPAAKSPDPARRLIRFSGALHNGADDVERLANAFESLLRETQVRRASS
jgi:hypothetical protein